MIWKEKQYFCDCEGLVKVKVSKSKVRCNICGNWMTQERPLTISLFRKIVKDHLYEEINGFIVDVQTAHAIMTIHDHLNHENKRKFLMLPVNKLGQIAWQLIK